ncbi:DNA polymerase III subunit delta [Terrarubrum flagellatum]|uniref:DNA polymerase III subunit delta n=1 Tax=Terrirubrum flagellatum TaxID=2895980 RepID=UPI003144DFC3
MAVSAASVADPSDPFQLIRMEGDEIASDPLKLADEANAIGLFGGRKALRVRVGSKNIVSAVEPLLRAPPRDAAVVLEAGDLKKSAPLRVACEKSSTAAVIACYADDPAELQRLVSESFRKVGLSIDPEAEELLLSMLGGDRLASRGEVEKLITYATGSNQVTAEDVEAVVGDASAAALNEAIDGAFGGNTGQMLPALSKLLAEGERPDMILSAALTHSWTLAQALAQVDAGQQARTVAERAIPFFRRRAAFERQLQIWKREGMAPTIRQLGESILASRANSELAIATLDRTLLRIALGARRAG